jgi:predicted ATPase
MTQPRCWTRSPRLDFGLRRRRKQSRRPSKAWPPPLRRGAQIPVVIAQACGAPRPDQLRSVIRDRSLLLVLDNCEHVLDDVGSVVADLLGACPELRVLATSREPIVLPGELTWPVPPLTADAAQALFRDRATVQVAAGDEELIAQMCQQLHGHPLAIELAAARLRSVPLQEVARRLADQLGFLVGGSRVVARQKTLRATLDWSHDLLTDDEQVLLRRLSVFAGGFSLDAAEKVAAVPATIDVVDALDGLVQRSLVEYAPAQARYRLLEPVRQYAYERLEAALEAGDTSASHRAWAVRFAEEASRNLLGDQIRWSALLTVETGNLGAAIASALGADDLTTATRLVSALSWFWYTSGRGDGYAWVPAVLAQKKELAPLAAARAQLAGGIVFCDVPRDDRAVAWLAGAEDTFRGLSHRRGLASALFWHGRALVFRDHQDEAKVRFEEAASLHAELGDLFGYGWSVIWLAMLAQQLDGDVERARVMVERVVDQARDAGIEHIAAAATAELGMMAARRGDISAAIGQLTEAIDGFRSVRDRSQTAIWLHHRSRIRLQCGQLDEAASDVQEAMRIDVDIRAEGELLYVLFTAAALLSEASRNEAAVQIFAAMVHRVGTTPGFWNDDTRARYDRLVALHEDPRHAAAATRGSTLEPFDAAEQALEELARTYAGEPI